MDVSDPVDAQSAGLCRALGPVLATSLVHDPAAATRRGIDTILPAAIALRFIAGPNNRIVVPLSVILGGAFLMLVDTACRTVTPSEIPLGILTSVIGAPLFFIILLRSQRGARS